MTIITISNSEYKIGNIPEKKSITKHLLFRESYFIVTHIKHKVYFVQ